MRNPKPIDLRAKPPHEGKVVRRGNKLYVYGDKEGVRLLYTLDIEEEE